jgi:DNA-binding GntR family transcriptional regulator
MISKPRQLNIRHELSTILECLSKGDSPISGFEVETSAGSRAITSAKEEAARDGERPLGSEAEQRVYTAMRDAILDHRLSPGTKLKEVTLAELFGVSRATIRAALARLGHGRLVELRLNRGAVVASPSAAESREVFEARRALEGAILGKATHSATVKDISDLRDLVSAEQAAYDCGDERAGLRLSIEFHRRLAAIAGNGVLAGYLEQLLLRTPLIALTHRGNAPSMCGCDEHLAIVDAIAALDESRAIEQMHRHIDRLESELTFQRQTPRLTLTEIFGTQRAAGRRPAAKRLTQRTRRAED